MFRCIECYLTKTARDPISVAIKLLYCMILTVYLSYLYKYLLPIAVMPFIYIRIKLKKTAHCEFYEQFSGRLFISEKHDAHRGCSYKTFE